VALKGFIAYDAKVRSSKHLATMAPQLVNYEQKQFITLTPWWEKLTG